MYLSHLGLVCERRLGYEYSQTPITLLFNIRSNSHILIKLESDQADQRLEAASWLTSEDDHPGSPTQLTLLDHLFTVYCCC
jgi:hypothetical protein